MLVNIYSEQVYSQKIINTPMAIIETQTGMNQHRQSSSFSLSAHVFPNLLLSQIGWVKTKIIPTLFASAVFQVLLVSESLLFLICHSSFLIY